MRLRQLACLLALSAAVGGSPAPSAAPAPAPAPAPGRWRFDEAVAGGGTRQARRIAPPSSDSVNILRPAPETTTTPAPRVTKKLVTLAPGGNSIQDILFNNGYRDSPADAEPAVNNIDDERNLDGLARKDVWLLDGNLLVLKGGAFSGGFTDTEPLDDYQAPYRQPKFPPLEFLGVDELPPDLLAAWQFGFPGLDGLFEARPPALGPEGTRGYSPYGRPESRLEEPESVAGPHSNVGAQPYDGGEPYPPGQPHTDSQPYVDEKPYTYEQPYVDGTPYTSAEPYTDENPYTSAEPYPEETPYTSAEPYSDGKPYTSDEPYVDIQKYKDGQSYAEVPYTDSGLHEGEKPYEEPSEPVNPELMKGYSPLGRPEPRPDSLYETPRIESLPESQIRISPEGRPGFGPESTPQPIQPQNGQSYGVRRHTAVGGGGRVRFPDEPLEAAQPPSSEAARIGATRTRTYSVRTSYSSTSSQSSTSVRGHNARYLPPPGSQRGPSPR
ncbi:uncharacterized protein LOC122369283 [Amphibalanus amphitrite]|uniref:uncharacterized protein LOC122369283 n=1 Tax=Amphibalanus amphitrite TaxID=1232801 RepID=UPI001C91F9A3|nr:uncharacterized protein LOC122369283 [Amphibalanus amphitrite]XP_043199842.1 uncharacterized protein LOC122369283 [Amphibalanus amphitrite]